MSNPNGFSMIDDRVMVIYLSDAGQSWLSYKQVAGVRCYALHYTYQSVLYI